MGEFIPVLVYLAIAGVVFWCIDKKSRLAQFVASAGLAPVFPLLLIAPLVWIGELLDALLGVSFLANWMQSGGFKTLWMVLTGVFLLRAVYGLFFRGDSDADVNE